MVPQLFSPLPCCVSLFLSPYALHVQNKVTLEITFLGSSQLLWVPWVIKLMHSVFLFIIHWLKVGASFKQTLNHKSERNQHLCTWSAFVPKLLSNKCNVTPMFGILPAWLCSAVCVYLCDCVYFLPIVTPSSSLGHVWFSSYCRCS